MTDEGNNRDCRVKPKLACELCGLGPPDGPSIYRVNTGEMPARWRCEKHLNCAVDPDVKRLTKTLEGLEQ